MTKKKSVMGLDDANSNGTSAVVLVPSSSKRDYSAISKKGWVTRKANAERKAFMETTRKLVERGEEMQARERLKAFVQDAIEVVDFAVHQAEERAKKIAAWRSTPFYPAVTGYPVGDWMRTTHGRIHRSDWDAYYEAIGTDQGREHLVGPEAKLTLPERFLRAILKLVGVKL